MTDKYEEFKEWFLGLRDCDIPRKTKLEEMHINSMTWANPVYAKTEYDRRRIFEKFEEEQKEKEQEKEVKEILEKHYPSITIDTDFGKQCLTKCSINDCYDELKEKGCLK